MKFGFHCTSACLFAAIVAAVSTIAQADDKPATARKPVPPESRERDAAIKSLAFEPTGRLLYSVAELSQPRTLGVAVTPADPVLRANVPATKGKLGLVVTSVVKDSPAAKAEIHANDILLTFTGNDLATVSDLTVAVRKAKSPATLTFVRGGKPMTVRVRFPESAKTVRNAWRDFDLVVRLDRGSKYTIGVSSKPVDPTLAAQLVLPPSTGFIVTSVAKDSAAAKAGLQQHDVILTVADRYVSSAWDLGKALDKAAGKPVKIEFIRSGRKQSATVTPTKRETGANFRLWSQPVIRGNRIIYTPDGGRALIGRKAIQWQIDAGIEDLYRRSAAPDLNSQVDRLSKQVDELKKTLDALKKQLSVRKTKVKVIKSK